MQRIQVKVQEINAGLLHEELLAVYPDCFRGLIYQNSLVTLIVEDTVKDKQGMIELVNAHDPCQESTAELAARLDIEAFVKAEVTIAEETDPLTILEARVTRLEAFLRQRPN